MKKTIVFWVILIVLGIGVFLGMNKKLIFLDPQSANKNRIEENRNLEKIGFFAKLDGRQDKVIWKRVR